MKRCIHPSGFVILFILMMMSAQADYLEQTLEQAHILFRTATNETMYAKAAQQYELLVEEENIRNGNLFYTLGNSWFMAGDPGRAILNYRRAERFMPNATDLKYNLDTARNIRTDLISEQQPHPLASKLLGWHLHTSTSLRWWSFSAVWILFWTALVWMNRIPRRGTRITAISSGILSAVLLISLSTESISQSRTKYGVIIAPEIMARKGDGIRYAPAFREPLHSGTEVKIFEQREHWRYVRLVDGNFCWIPANAVEMVNNEQP